MYHVTHLDNGLAVATAEMPHMTSVSVGIWVRVGTRFEAPKANGVCHFIEHLLFKGTSKRSAKQISEAVEGVGGYLNAFTSEEMTCFHARASHDRLPDLLDVLTDMLLNSKFAPDDIRKERDVIKEEIAMYLDQPQHQVQEVLNEMLWPGQPLGRPITGTPATLDGLDRAALLRHLNENYVASATLIVAAGKVSHKQLLRRLKPYVRRFASGPRPEAGLVADGQITPKIRLVSKKTEQTQLALAIRTCSRHDARRYPLRLLNTILGENMSSRLFQIIREDHGLAYSIYSSPSFFEDTGDLVISAGLDTDNLEKTLRLILRELRRLLESPPSAAELRRARDFVLGQIALGQESTENQMNWVGEQLLGYNRIFRPADIRQQLLAVTPADIRNVARDFFQPSRLNLALVSPLKSEKSLMRVYHL
ncbi:MAG TPA: pitrilysin family protein [Candidatus Dormibacteraeota bacterium]|nr:pitrilysin family protein [Candidatus Dormibacteraeota bacterium]